MEYIDIVYNGNKCIFSLKKHSMKNDLKHVQLNFEQIPIKKYKTSQKNIQFFYFFHFFILFNFLILY